MLLYREQMYQDVRLVRSSEVSDLLSRSNGRATMCWVSKNSEDLGGVGMNKDLIALISTRFGSRDGSILPRSDHFAT